MALTKNAQIALGVGVVAIIVLAFFFLRGGGGPVETTVYLANDAQNGGCLIPEGGKEQEVTAGEAKQVHWIINHDGCNDKQAVVTVGNFRQDETTSTGHCRDATTQTNGIWLFAQPEGLQHRQSHSVIALTTKGRTELAEGTYYYDICAGSNAEKKSDPRLVIDY